MKKIAHLLTGNCNPIILCNDGRTTTSTAGKEMIQSRVSYLRLLKTLQANGTIVQKMKSADNIGEMDKRLLPNERVTFKNPNE